MTIDISYVYIYGPITFLCLLFLLIYLARDYFQAHFPKLWQWVADRILAFGLGILLLLLLAIIIAPKILISVPSGYKAVVWKRFQGGTILGCAYPEGTFMLPPWDRVYLYIVRYQVLDFDMRAISSEGLSVDVNAIVRFRISSEDVTQLHQLIGPEYTDKIIVPEVTAAVRSILSKYSADQIYYSKREQIQREIHQLLLGEILIDLNRNPQSVKPSGNLATSSDVQKKMVQKSRICQNGSKDEGSAPSAVEGELEAPQKNFTQFIILQDILLREITLPERVHDAIISKVNQRYLYEEYENRLLVEGREAKRKEIEANGIAQFQTVVAEGISPGYLRWKGIEATLKLSESDNAKVVIIGSGKDGLPIILNAETNSENDYRKKPENEVGVSKKTGP